MKRTTDDEMSFWEHLDVLRLTLFKTAVAVLAGSIVAFLLKDEVFDLLLAPKDKYGIQLINTALTGQFCIHMHLSLYIGALMASPYILYLLYSFIAPALIGKEKEYAAKIVVGGYFMFFLGVILNYFLIFPFTFQFLGSYQVSDEIENLISLQSYIDTLVMMSFMLGSFFELPVVSWLLGKIGVLKASIMRRYRRHAIVAILLVAAIITPTSDVFTLLLVAVPIWLLFEVSILFVK